MAFYAQVCASPEKSSWQIFFGGNEIFPHKKILRFANKQKLEQNILLSSTWLKSWRMVWVNLAGTAEELFLVPVPSQSRFPLPSPPSRTCPGQKLCLKHQSISAVTPCATSATKGTNCSTGWSNMQKAAKPFLVVAVRTCRRRGHSTGTSIG